MPQVQGLWNKLNPRERLTVWGALGVAVGWIIGLIGSYGFGGNTLALVGAIAAVVVLYLKYSPTQSITWPAPVSTIVLGISAFVALLGLLALLGILQLLGLAGAFGGFFAAAILAGIVTAAGAGVMLWGAWQEYQVSRPATTTGPAGSVTPPPVPPAWTAPSPSDTTQPPATQPPTASDSDDLPNA